MKNTEVKPLGKMQSGQIGTVVAFTGSHESRERLSSMGICIGCEIKLLVRAPGRFMLAVNEARIAIGSQAAEDILIAAEEPEDVIGEAVKRLKQIWAR
jgi:Fe2+ transport system protein FeoA